MAGRRSLVSRGKKTRQGSIKSCLTENTGSQDGGMAGCIFLSRGLMILVVAVFIGVWQAPGVVTD